MVNPAIFSDLEILKKRQLLFNPLNLGKLVIPNRIAMAPMTRSMCPGGIPGPEVAQYYARRAYGGVGLIITEGTAIDHLGAIGYPDVPHIYGDEAIKGWSRVTSRVHEAGGKIFCQLWHVGSYRRPDFDLPRKIPLVGPSAVIHPAYGEDSSFLPAALSVKDIQEVIRSYARAGARAREAGFDGVEIHGAHGYLIDQFFWTKTNQRKDEYGGSLLNRTRLAVEVIKSVRTAVGNDFVIGFRFSQWKTRFFDDRIAATPQELENWLKPLALAGVDIFHASTQRFDRPAFEGDLKTLSGWTKELTGKPLIAVGKIGVNQELAQERKGALTGLERDIKPLIEKFAAGEFDVAAVGRALLGDSDWANKVKEGRVDEIKPYSVECLKTLV